LIRHFDDRLAGSVTDDIAGCESPLSQASEQIELARIVGAGDEVEDAVAIEVHELGTRADASVDPNLGIDAAGLKIDGFRVPRLAVGADVPIEPEQTAEVSHDQVVDAVAVDVSDPRPRMAPRRA